jgi:prefoldin alpha subunit
MVNNMENVDARELQMLEQYLEQFTQQVEAYSRQLEMLENRRMETATAVETLNNLAGQEEPTVLLQIGGGASLRVHVPDTDQVLLNIGADVVVERTNTETVDYLGERMTEMEALAKKNC